MKTNRSINLNLSAYSTMALAVLYGGKVNAEVIYTDVVPDEQINVDEGYYIDINDDGTDDFGLYNFFWSGKTIENIYAYSGAAITGYIGTFLGYSVHFASVINSGSLIGPSANWLTGTYSTYGVLWANFTPYGSVGLWNDITEKYIGLRFTDDVNIYYGWARLNVSHTTITLKDYAYESASGVGITAGEIGTVNITATEMQEITIYSFNHTVYIHLSKEIPNARVNIYNLLGEVIYTQELNSRATQIDMKVNKSEVYLVEVLFQGNKLVKKLFIE